MAITLVTGVPGAGKTLRTIFLLLKKKEEGRPIFHIGIDGMNPDLVPESPVPIERWKELPAGSVIAVDEAHKVFPVRQPGRPPEWIQLLTEIRHFGIELILITQDPRNLDSFVRRLIGEHQHLTRKAGLNGAMVRTFQGVSEDPNDYGNRLSSTQEPWKYPKHLFQAYKSASLHVIQPKIPKKVLFGLGLLILLPLVILGAVFLTKDTVDAVDDKDDQETSVSEKPRSSTPHSTGSPWDSPEAFAKALTPLVPSIPISAPLYRDAQILSRPRLFCYAAGYPHSRDRTCKCYTEQHTRVSIETPLCEKIVKDGLYDPFISPNQPPVESFSSSISAEEAD